MIHCAFWTWVRLPPGPPWGCSSVGRAPALQAGGYRFDPDRLHLFKSRPGCPGRVVEAAEAVPGPQPLPVGALFAVPGYASINPGALMTAPTNPDTLNATAPQGADSEHTPSPPAFGTGRFSRKPRGLSGPMMMCSARERRVTLCDALIRNDSPIASRYLSVFVRPPSIVWAESYRSDQRTVRAGC